MSDTPTPVPALDAVIIESASSENGCVIECAQPTKHHHWINPNDVVGLPPYVATMEAFAKSVKHHLRFIYVALLTIFAFILHLEMIYLWYITTSNRKIH
jgi:hypothetical protein